MKVGIARLFFCLKALSDMHTSPAIAKIETMLEPAVEALGYRLVQVRLIESAKSQTLQIMAERTDGANMTVDDCALISRTVSALLDVEDPIKTAYSLEVSSPGIDRPLVKPEDFATHIGFEVKIETAMPIEGQRRYKGILIAADAVHARVRAADKRESDIPLSAIQYAKLVLTDALVREHLKNAKHAHKNEND